MLCDYLFVRRGHYRITDLYKAEKGTWYYYNAGIHWRGFVAYLCGVAINLPGFIKEFVPSLPMSIAATRIYQLVRVPENGSTTDALQSWFTGVVTSGSVYYLLCCISPPPGMSRHWEEVDESNYEDNTSIDHFDEPAGVPSEERSSADLEKEAFNESEKRQTSVKVLAA
jgi:NCS1 family nucleobase:cation symporter-1